MERLFVYIEQNWASVYPGGAGVGNLLPGWVCSLLYVHGPVQLAALRGSASLLYNQVGVFEYFPGFGGV